jgi:hypothetical protein
MEDAGNVGICGLSFWWELVLLPVVLERVQWYFISELTIDIHRITNTSIRYLRRLENTVNPSPAWRLVL